MKRLFLVGIIAIIAGAILAIPLLTDQLANARIIKKIQFTETVKSSPDPGQGHGNEQMAFVLLPSNGTLYHGTITYSASAPIQVVILHHIDKTDANGQPTWTVDGNTVYAETTINPESNGGSLDFTGSAIGLHSTNSSQFSATVSFDGWIRGITPEAMQQGQIVVENKLNLFNSQVPVNIPLHKGFYNGDSVFYIITDSSNNAEAQQLSKKQDWKIQNSPVISQLPQNALSKLYVFTNGVSGNGTKGFQDEVFSSDPDDKQYTPLSLVVHATWNLGMTPVVLSSEKEILDANSTGKLRLSSTNTIINSPQIEWPTGHMAVRDNSTLSDETAYTGGQVLRIDTNDKFVTFVAHRAWGPEGKTIYYIITDATPEGPSKMLGMSNIPTLPILASSARDLYDFANGVKGGGPFGFQEGISSSQPGDSSYSPICKVSMVTWNDPKNASVMENINDIQSAKSYGIVTVEPASVYNNDYIIDCPIVDVSQSGP